MARSDLRRQTWRAGFRRDLDVSVIEAVVDRLAVFSPWIVAASAALGRMVICDRTFLSMQTAAARAFAASGARAAGAVAVGLGLWRRAALRADRLMGDG